MKAQPLISFTTNQIGHKGGVNVCECVIHWGEGERRSLLCGQVLLLSLFEEHRQRLATFVVVAIFQPDFKGCMSAHSFTGNQCRKVGYNEQQESNKKKIGRKKQSSPARTQYRFVLLPSSLGSDKINLQENQAEKEEETSVKAN